CAECIIFCVLISGNKSMWRMSVLRSAEIAGLKGGVGLVDDLQLFFCLLVAAVGVRMVKLYECFIACFEQSRGEWRLDLEDGKGLFTSRRDACCRAGIRSTIMAPGCTGSGYRAQRITHPVIPARPMQEA